MGGSAPLKATSRADAGERTGDGPVGQDHGGRSPEGRSRKPRWWKAALERKARGTLEDELDLFERASKIRPLHRREWEWVVLLLEVGGYELVK